LLLYHCANDWFLTWTTWCPATKFGDFFSFSFLSLSFSYIYFYHF
jgi:hypothetical protein